MRDLGLTYGDSEDNPYQVSSYDQEAHYENTRHGTIPTRESVYT